MKRLIRFLRNKLQDLEHRKAMGKQSIATQKLRAEKKSDYLRWERTEQLFDDWNERTALLSNMIRPGSKVIEFGAGNMFLKDLLPESCSYTASDIVKRNPETLICDLNNKIPFNLLSYDTVVFSGVLEYVYDLEDIFNQFPHNIKYVILSYSCFDISTANRLRNGWLSDYSKKDLERIFKLNQYTVVDYKEWRNQSLFSLEKTD